jgi:flagellar hook protein FlgE
MNTVAYKKGNATFADTLYQTIGTQAGAAQVGLGMSVETVSQNFKDGSLETTSNSTDLAIGGNGFFIVSEAGSDDTFYTRAGNFSFNKSGALVNSSGYILQGWEVDDDGEPKGAIKDLILSAFTSSPKDTEEVTVITNLESDSKSNTNVLSNSYEYDEDDDTYMPSDAYEYQTVVTVYDSLGSAHEVTVYYDKVSDTEWEYTIATTPEEDKRSLVQGTNAQGLLARGTITFSESSGKVVSMTMEEFTGRIGNLEATGNNTIDDINFEIEDSEAMELDGYGISMTYNGSEWVLDTSTLPDNYKNAEIIYSDDQNISIVLDPDSSGGTDEADLKIKLDQMSITGDTISFDINDIEDIHQQKLENVDAKTGGTSISSTTTINDPSVLTKDSEDCCIIWNPVTEKWQWSNPEKAAADGTLITDMSSTNPTGASSDIATYMAINNASAMDMKLEDLKVRYNSTTNEWDWNDALKKDDITTTSTFTSTDTTATMEIITAGDEGAIDSSGNITLSWDGTSWTATGSSGLTATIVTSATDSTKVQVQVYTPGNSAEASTIQYNLDKLTTAGGDTIEFSIDPTPPEEYDDGQSTTAGATGKAVITTTANGFEIDFDGDSSTDLTYTGVIGTINDGDILDFTIDPDTPPEEYADATISGDKTKAIIDLDGSGGDDDNDDIEFTFSEDLKSGAGADAGTDRTEITFDISGSTAWREVTSDEASDTGYLQFSADFLGGEFGSTESDISFNIGSKYDGNNWVNDALSTTQYSSSSSTTYQDSDGYPPGDLTGVEVDSDGVVTGSYSNGQDIPLFMIALANFNNYNGLESEGGNLFSATINSGAAITNRAGANGLGKLSSYSLEQSNVDISEEFVSMIELQNAYEANAKTISTVDEMMDTVISMKR